MDCGTGKHARRFCAQTAVAEAHGDESGIESRTYLGLAEVAFGSHQNRHVALRKAFLHEVAPRDCGVAVGNEPLSVGESLHEIVKRREVVELRQRSLQRLLHRRHEDFAQAFRLQHLPLRVSAQERHDAVNAHLRHLLRHPFHAVHVFCRSDSHRDAASPVGLHVGCSDNLHGAVFGVGVQDAAQMEMPFSIDHLHLFALFQPQHAHAMLRLLVGEQHCRGNVGSIKSMHIDFLRCFFFILSVFLWAGVSFRSRTPP